MKMFIFKESLVSLQYLLFCNLIFEEPFYNSVLSLPWNKKSISKITAFEAHPFHGYALQKSASIKIWGLFSVLLWEGALHDSKLACISGVMGVATESTHFF